MIILKIDSKGKMVADYDAITSKGRVRRIVRTHDQLRNLIADYARRRGLREDDVDLMASSTLDFPEEYTKDPVVIAMAHELRRTG